MWRHKAFWMGLAEITDALRIFPRILIASYFSLAAWSTIYLTLWYAYLPNGERSVEVTAFYGMLEGGMFGIAAYVFKIYSDGGFDWDAYYRRKQCSPLSHQSESTSTQPQSPQS